MEDHDLAIPSQGDWDWPQSLFSLQMNEESSKTSSSSSTRKGRARSASQPSGSQPRDAALLAQFAASRSQDRSPPNSIESLVQALRAGQGGQPSAQSHLPLGTPANYFMEQNQQMDHSQLPPPPPPLPALSLPWLQQILPQYPYPTSYASQPGPAFAPERMENLYSGGHAIPLLSIDTDDDTTRRGQSLPAAPSPSDNSSSPDGPEQTEADRIASSEDKRRRNTAASARFRIKKKQRMLNLERSLSDLKGRAKDLESEAAELRRENGWLKEIVMLQGNHALASRRRQDRGATKGPSCSDDADGEDTDKRKKMGIEGYRC